MPKFTYFAIVHSTAAGGKLDRLNIDVEDGEDAGATVKACLLAYIGALGSVDAGDTFTIEEG